MIKSQQYLQGLAEDLIGSLKHRNQQNDAIDAMDECAWEWDMDEEPEYLRKTVSPAPSNALQTSVKVLGAETPKPKYTPIGSLPDDLETASNIERGLSWELKSAAQRSQTKLVPDVIRSAVSYAECATYVDYLPWRLKGQVSKKRMQYILRDGQFALTPFHPNNVYPVYSPLGLETVLVAKEMRASEVMDWWGDYAKGLLEVVEEDSQATVMYYDIMNWEQRLVWVTLDTHTVAQDKSEYVFLSEERERAFLPWAIRTSGTMLKERPELQRIPFLSNVYRAKLWQTLNLVQTLMTSEVLAYAAAPRALIQGPGADELTTDYGDVNKPVRTTNPALNYRELNPPTIDRALTEIFDRTKADLDAATSVQVLQNLNFPAGTAYATINAVLQTAIASLQPYKVLAEMALADIFRTMLFWIDEVDGEIVSYGTGKGDRGSQYKITKADFSTSAIYIDVELNASAPTDFLQRINAGTLLYQLGMPKARIFEDLNVLDPDQAMKERVFEDMQAEELALQSQQRQLELQQQALQQPNLQNLPQGPPAQPAFENTTGQGFDANMMGTPPQVAASGMTREELNGVTSGGEPLAEV